MNETRSDDTGGTRRRNWKRIVFKPSGEALAGASGTGLDGATLDATARDIIDLRQNLQRPTIGAALRQAYISDNVVVSD